MVEVYWLVYSVTKKAENASCFLFGEVSRLPDEFFLLLQLFNKKYDLDLKKTSNPVAAGGPQPVPDTTSAGHDK